SNNRGFHSRHQDGDEDAQWHGEQYQCIEGKCRQKSPTKVLCLADGSRVNEWMHPRTHVPRRCTTGDAWCHHNPKHAGQDRQLCDIEWRIDKAASAATCGSHQKKTDNKENREIEPGSNEAHLILELKAKDLPEFHEARPDIVMKYTC